MFWDIAPMWIAEELLRTEGFEDVNYVLKPLDQHGSVDNVELDIRLVASAEADMTITDIFSILPALDAGKKVVALGGIHGGCYELFSTSTVRSIQDLRGKTIAVGNFGRRAFVSAMVSYGGLDPRKDVKFLESWDGVQLLTEGKVDATLGFPPEPQIMRAKKIGVSIVNTAIDRPWSQYLCCMAIGNRDFVSKHPIATKRALRALLKAADLCAAEPERVARTLVERAFYKDYDYALQSLRDVPYKLWREYDSADSMRFYALRLHEVGMLKRAPQTLLGQGTDWRFIDQLRRELKV